MDEMIFEQTRAGVILKQSNHNGIYQTVPERWDNQPVVGIGRYAFANQSQLKRVTLPKTIETIENHAFYNCGELEQLILHHGLHSVGDGAFKNCRKLHEISVCGLSWLKSIVTDFTNEITLTITIDNHQIIKLLFPEYDYAFQEVIPPREFRSITYGSGTFYRACVTREEIDFREYDTIFPRAVREDDEKTVEKIAFYRLLYPYHLSNTAQKVYRDYLQQHAESVIQRVLLQRDMKRLELLLEHQLLSHEQLEAAVAMASKEDYPEAVSVLIDHQLSRFERPQKRFVL